MSIERVKSQSTVVPGPPVDVPQAPANASVGEKQNTERVQQARSGKTGDAAPPPKDAFGGAPVVPAQTLPVALRHEAAGTLQPVTDFAAPAAAFAALAAQLGAPQNTVAPSQKLELHATRLEQPSHPLQGYPKATLVAAVKTLALAQSGTLPLPANVLGRLEAKLAGVLTSPQAKVALSGPQQSAVATLAHATQAALNAAAGPLRFEIVRDRGDAALDTSDVNAMPAWAKDMLASALGFVPPVGEQGSGSGHGKDEGPAGEAAAAKTVGAAQRQGSAPAKTSAQASAEAMTNRFADAEPLVDDAIVIPSPALVQLEGVMRSCLGGFDFASMSVEDLVMVVMSQISADAATDMRGVLAEMKAINEKKKAQREFVQHLKSQRADAQAALRAEYDRRTQLDPMADEYLPPSVTFDAYSERQALWTKSGSFDGTDGIPPSPPPAIGLSPNTFYEPKPKDVELARRLEISSGQAASLMRIWEDDPETRLKWGTIEEWITGDPARGGLGLACPPSASQGARVDALIRARDPAVLNQETASKYNLSLADAAKLREHYKTQLTPEQQVGGFDAWLKQAPPAGLGLVGGSADNAAKVRAFFAAAAPTVSGTAPAQTMTAADLHARFGISEYDAQKLIDYYALLPQSWKDRIGGEENYLTKSSPLGVGMQAGSNNTAKVRDFFASQRSGASAAPGPYDVPGREPMQHDAAVGFVRGSGPSSYGDYTTKDRTARAIVEQAFERVPAELRADLELMLKGVVWLQLVDAHDNILDAQKAENLQLAMLQFIESATPDPATRQKMLNYVELRLAEVQKDLHNVSDAGGTPNMRAESWLVQADIVYQRPNDGIYGHGVNHVHGLGADGRVEWQNRFAEMVSEAGSQDSNHGALETGLAGFSNTMGFGDLGLATLITGIALATSNKYLDAGKFGAAAENLESMSSYDARGFGPDYLGADDGLPAASAEELQRLKAFFTDGPTSSALPQPATMASWPTGGGHSLAWPTSWNGVNPAPLSTREQAQLMAMLRDWNRASHTPYGAGMAQADATQTRLKNDPQFKDLVYRWFRDNGDSAFHADMAVRARNASAANQALEQSERNMDRMLLETARAELPFPPPANVNTPLNASERAELERMQATLIANQSRFEFEPERAFEGVDKRRFSELKHRDIAQQLAALGPVTAPGVISAGAIAAMLSGGLAPMFAGPIVFAPSIGTPPAAPAAATFDAAAARASLANLQAAARQPAHTELSSELSLRQLDSAIEQWSGEMDSTSELGEEMQIRIQLFMDRYTRANSTLSNLLKKISDTSAGLIANMK